MRRFENFIRNLITAFLLALGLYVVWESIAHAESPSAPDAKPAVYLVIENGGTVTKREEALKTVSFMLGELVKLRRRRATRDTAIHIILTANPTEVTWSGTPQQLFDQGGHVMELITFKDTCSDLALAWDQVHLTTRITRPGAVSLIGVGPMIHAGFPCDEGETTISLPQKPPEGLRMAQMVERAEFLRLLNVHADQDEVYLDYLEANGAMARIAEGTLNFDLLDRARTRATLGRIMGDH